MATVTCCLCQDEVSDHRRRKRFHGTSCANAKAQLGKVMGGRVDDLEELRDPSAALCNTCERALNTISNLETRISSLRQEIKDKVSLLKPSAKRPTVSSGGDAPCPTVLAGGGAPCPTVSAGGGAPCPTVSSGGGAPCPTVSAGGGAPCPTVSAGGGAPCPAVDQPCQQEEVLVRPTVLAEGGARRPTVEASESEHEDSPDVKVIH